MRLAIPVPIDSSKAKIRFTYSASDPDKVTFTGTGAPTYHADPAGKLRIWKKDGSKERKKEGVQTDGDYVPNGEPIPVSKFGDVNEIIPLYIEAVDASTALGDLDIKAELDPDGDGPLGYVFVDLVKVTVVKVDLGVDTNRDGKITENIDDEIGEEGWTTSKGAIYSVNFDNDEGRTDHGIPIPDTIYIDDNGWGGSTEDYEIRNTNDLEDITPMVIRKIQPGVPLGWRVFLRIADRNDVFRIHVYKKIAVGETVILGNGSIQNPPLEVDITSWVDPASPNFQGDPITGNATFGIEGLSFRNQGSDVPGYQTFDGDVDFIIELRDNTNNVMSSDAVSLKVAPWIMLSRDQATEEVWAAKFYDEDINNNGIFDLGEDINGDGFWDAGNDEFLFNSKADLGLGYKGLDESGQLQTVIADTQWLQDHIEIGFTQRPGGPKMHMVLRLPYGGKNPLWAVNKLLKPGVGVFQLGADLGATKNAADFGGNLEILPPDTAHKLGRIVLGNSSSPSARLKQFLESQEVQSPVFDVPIDWLDVAHIDEITSFLPGGVVAIADPTTAWNLLEAIDPAEQGRSVFFATGVQPISGIASDNSTVNGRIETVGINYTGQPWKYIRIYEGAAAGTVGEIATLGNGFITVSKVWNTSSKILDSAYLAGAPFATSWRPQAGDKYVLCQGTQFFDRGSPAIITVKEILSAQNAKFKELNITIIQAKIDAARAKLKSASNGLTFRKVPSLFFGNYIDPVYPATIGDIEQGSAGAFNPGPTNLQVVNGKLYVPRQFSPRSVPGNKDIFEEAIRTELGSTVEFVDCWVLYHMLQGEVHCGSAVKHSKLNFNWWENQP
jgi:hypothetical protein